MTFLHHDKKKKNNGNGMYYDPSTGRTGNVSDLNLAPFDGNDNILGEQRNLVYSN